MVIPKPLRQGARVALIAPAGPVPPEKLDPAADTVKQLGLEPVIFESCRALHGYFAGSDDLRASDINCAFADKSMAGVLCMRGGYGTQRLMNRIDFNLIRQNPKVFCGYSDITALHIAINQQCRLVTYHTPMPVTELCAGADSYTMNGLKTALFTDSCHTLKNPDGVPMETLVAGCAHGTLTGGNLSLVSSSLGTCYEIDTRGKILFLEDVDEEPYRIDGMLNHLRAAGKFRDCAGIMLGYFTNCSAKEGEPSLTLAQIAKELIVPEQKPAVMGVACGHSLPTMSLPMGKIVELNTFFQQIRVLG